MLVPKIITRSASATDSQRQSHPDESSDCKKFAIFVQEFRKLFAKTMQRADEKRLQISCKSLAQITRKRAAVFALQKEDNCCFLVFSLMFETVPRGEEMDHKGNVHCFL